MAGIPYPSRVTRFQSRGGALVAGALLPAAFAPFELYWIAPISLAILFSLWQQSNNRGSAALIGLLFGIGLFGVGASWIQVSIQQFGGVNLTLSLLLTLLFIVAMALFPALLGWTAFLFKRRPLSLPLLWVLFEWVRSTLFGGFPWLLLGHTAPGTFYQGIAPLTGTLGVSLFLALAALLLMQLFREPARRLHHLAGIALLLLSGWGSSQLQWTNPAGEPISVALVQGNIEQSQKWLIKNREGILQRYREATEGSDARLVVWPETAVPAFHHQVEGELLTPLGKALRQQGRTLLAGIPIQTDQGGGYLNGLVQLGAEQGAYHKRHLVPFGEFLPMRELLGPILDFIQIPMSDFSGGDPSQPPLRVADHSLSTTICYEVAYPDLTFTHLPEAGMLITVSNDAWFGDSLAPWQHLQIARMRALESGRPMLRATNTGITAVVGPNGEVTQTIPRARFGVLETEVQPMEGRTPYLRWFG